MKVVVLMGQSNMSGRGNLKDSVLPMEGVNKWDGNQWVKAVEPLHFDAPKAAMGLAGKFAEEACAAENNIEIGFVATAVGGTEIARWIPGGDLFENAIRQTKLALESVSGAELSAVLWHQGESDCNCEERASKYFDRFIAMVAEFRSLLNQPSLPFIIGELGRFVVEHEPSIFYTSIVESHAKAIPLIQPAALVSTDGLLDRGDNLHFDSSSLHELGRRYYAAYHKLVK